MSTLPASSAAVQLSWPEEGVALVTLEDRATRNRFSAELVAGLRAVFDSVTADPRTRTVVVSGYDTYFCCGGTLEELLDLADRRLEFTAFDYFDQLLRCPLPVIAAMQGHAIGGGLVYGAYADLIVLAEESVYSANFMEFGFTPGLGATSILPLRFGDVLGREMLLTARNYRGAELRDRGAPVRVVPRSAVLAEALALAADLARKPASTLRLLKASLVEAMRPAHDAAVQRERRMHDACFADPGVRAMILERYQR